MEQHVSSTHHHVPRAHVRFTHSPNIILSLQLKPMKSCVKMKCNAHSWMNLRLLEQDYLPYRAFKIHLATDCWFPYFFNWGKSLNFQDFQGGGSGMGLIRVLQGGGMVCMPCLCRDKWESSWDNVLAPHWGRDKKDTMLLWIWCHRRRLKKWPEVMPSHRKSGMDALSLNLTKLLGATNTPLSPFGLGSNYTQFWLPNRSLWTNPW